MPPWPIFSRLAYRAAASDARNAPASGRIPASFGTSVRLFGSYARGDFGPDSDADVLVVVEGLTHAEKKEIFSLAADRFLDHLVRVSPLALSSDEHGLLERQDRLILREIARDGVAL